MTNKVARPVQTPSEPDEELTVAARAWADDQTIDQKLISIILKPLRQPESASAEV